MKYLLQSGNKLRMFIAFIFLLVPSMALAKGKVKLDVRLGQSKILQGSEDNIYLRVDLEGFRRSRRQRRAPINVALVLDQSGSMKGRRLRYAKAAAKKALKYLNKNDIVSVVAYDRTVQVLVPATKATDKRAIRVQLDELRAQGTTALYEGVKTGGQELEKFLDENSVNRVILLSDGQANVGPRTPSELGALGADLASKGISVTTIGLGLGYNEDLMTQLALSSDGNHAFVENPKSLSRIFAREFGDVISVVAKDVDILIRCHNGITPVRVLGREAKINGQSIRMKMGQLLSRQEKYIVVELLVDQTEFESGSDVASVEVDYLNLVKGERQQLEDTVAMEISDSERRVNRSVSRDVMRGVVRQIAIEKNEMAVKLRDKGKVKEARKILKDNSVYLNKQARKLRSKVLRRLQRQTATDAKKLSESSMDWRRQRKAMKARQYKGKVQQSY